MCLVGRAAEKVELEWKLQEQEQAAVKSQAAAVAAAVGAAEDRVKGQVEAELAVRLEAGKAEAEAGWSELVDILSAQAMEVRTNQLILPPAPGVSNEGRSSPLLALAGCFLALGSGLGLVGTASSRR